MKKSVKTAAAVAAVIVLAVVAPALTLCVIFPNRYAQEIAAAADEFDLSRSLVKSVVWTESRFDKNATSPKGAKGLM